MHFTYDHPETTCLRQGDVLRRTEGVDSILAQVHPHYHQNAANRFLIVLTQSCDLERRAGQSCKARYITIAAVRLASLAIEREIDNHRTALEARARVAKQSHRFQVERFVEHLLNNNEPAYFYLHEDITAGLDEPQCAFLRLSIPIKARLHYETCLAAKLLQLKPEFQAKLGWLVGDMYSRIGTADWVPTVESEADFKARVTKIVESETLWVEPKKHKLLLTALEQCTEPITLDVATRELKRISLPTRKQKVVARLRDLVDPLPMDEAARRNLYNQLDNDSDLAELLK
jgi:hypothetical protein